MSEFRKGDVCSLEVTVTDAPDSAAWIRVFSGGYGDFLVSRSNPTLKLLRRAPVDLATCDLSEPVRVVDKYGRAWLMVHRHEHLAAVVAPPPAGGQTWEKISNLRPADAPAPAAPPDRIRVAQDAEGFWTCREAVSGSQEYIRADLAPAPAAEAGEVERLRAALVNIVAGCRPKGDAATEDYYLRRIEGIAKEALASTAPSCPPGHVLINGHVVPEPMREEPREDDAIWLANTTGVQQLLYSGNGAIRHWLRLGILHSTRGAADIHHEALIAPTKREGV